MTAFERIGQQIEELWQPQFFEPPPPDVFTFLREVEL